MLETTGEDPARLDRLSTLAAEMEGYQLLSDNQSLSQIKIQTFFFIFFIFFWVGELFMYV